MRRWSLRDVDDAHAWLSDPEVHRFLNPEAVCRTREDTERTVHASMDRQAKTGWNMWAVELRETGRVVGRAGIKHHDGGWKRFDAAKAARGAYEMEVGYAYARHVWGRGLASEVASALVAWGFRVKKLPRIVGVCVPANLASRRVLEKAGLVYERQDDEGDGMIVDYLAKNADSYLANAAP